MLGLCFGLLLGVATAATQTEALKLIASPVRTIQAATDEAKATSGFELQGVLRMGGLNLCGLSP